MCNVQLFACMLYKAAAALKSCDNVLLPAAGRAAAAGRQDSFDRPDSPLFHETLPLPVESAIRRHRQRSRGRGAGAGSQSSSDSDGQLHTNSAVPRPAARRQQRRHQRRRAASAGAKSGRARPAAQRTRFNVTRRTEDQVHH